MNISDAEMHREFCRTLGKLVVIVAVSFFIVGFCIGGLVA